MADPHAPSPPPQAHRRRGTWSFRLGLALMATGLGLLGYAGWQLHGTNYVSQARHERTVESLRQEWARPGATGSVMSGDSYADAIVRVPGFGDDYAVPLVEGVSDEALASGIGHFTDSAAPGGTGNFAVAGHRITHGEPLRDMPDLVAGDEIVVETRDRVYTYVLDTGGEDLRVSFTARWVTSRVPINPDGGVGPDPNRSRLITLTTCAELFHTDERLIAFGHLVSSEKRQAPSADAPADASGEASMGTSAS